MKTREEIEAEISKLNTEREVFANSGDIRRYDNIGYRLRALEWVLEETEENPLTHIELKQLRAIMREHQVKSEHERKFKSAQTFPFPRD